MKTRNLALRVALNSAVMIFAVYLVMQTVVYFRDCLIFETSDLSDFGAAVFGFIGGRVLPPLAVFGFLLWWAALPIQKVQQRLEAGEVLTPEEAEATRNRILRFRSLVLAVNLVGFTVGFLLDLVLGNKLIELTHVHRLIILCSNLAGAFVYSAAQSSLNNVAFAPLRDRLGITAIGGRRREPSSTARQIRLSAALVLYVSLVVQYNLWDEATYQSWGDEVLTQVSQGTLTREQATDAFRTLVAERLPQLSSRSPEIAKTLTPVWELKTPPATRQETIFLLLFALMLIISLGVQAAVSREQKGWLAALRLRIQDVVDGQGDLRKRLSLRSMDDLGELAELVNRLLDQFQTIVTGIGEAAGRTREGAQSVQDVLARAEAVSQQVGGSVAALRAELEDQLGQARLLNDALGDFRDAASAVDSEAVTQGRFVAETAAAMDEMGQSIDGVRQQSRQAGDLTETLSRQGEGGGQAVKETADAISTIHQSSRQVLQVLGALSKIAADTNLLAMNAAIEAAHAGDRGAGFAVVADEVRKLANTAADRTKAIKALIEAMARQVEAGVARSQTSGSVLAHLAKGLQDSAEVSRAVADALDEQAERTRSVRGSLTQVVHTSEVIRTKMAVQSETTERMGASLGRALGRLSGLVEVSNRQGEAVAGLEQSFAEVRREVESNAKAADTLKAELARFLV
jgi:methyl-accepting chemotaxis protein